MIGCSLTPSGSLIIVMPAKLESPFEVKMLKRTCLLLKAQASVLY